MTYSSSLSQSSRMHESKYMSDTELQNKKLLQSSHMHESKSSGRSGVACGIAILAHT